MRQVGVHSEVGKLRTVTGLQAFPRASAADPRQLPQSAVRRRDVGPRGPEGSLRLRPQDAAAGRRGARIARPPGRDDRPSPRVDGSCSTGSSRRIRSASRTASFMRPWLDELESTLPRQSSDRRDHHLRPARRHRQGDDGGGLRRRRVHPAADPEHLVPARPVLLDLRRRHLQPDVSGPRASRKPCCSAPSTSSTRLSARPTSRSGGATATSSSPRRRSRAEMSCRSATASSWSGWASGRPIRPSASWLSSCSATRPRRASSRASCPRAGRRCISTPSSHSATAISSRSSRTSSTRSGASASTRINDEGHFEVRRDEQPLARRSCRRRLA